MNFLLLTLQYLPTILQAVVAVEQVIGAGKGSTKKQIIMDSVSAAAKVTTSAAPTAQIQLISQMIDSVVSTLNSVGALSKPAPVGATALTGQINTGTFVHPLAQQETTK